MFLPRRIIFYSACAFLMFPVISGVTEDGKETCAEPISNPMTEDQLEAFNGTVAGRPILLALSGVVYDVTSGPYNVFFCILSARNQLLTSGATGFRKMTRTESLLAELALEASRCPRSRWCTIRVCAHTKELTLNIFFCARFLGSMRTSTTTFLTSLKVSWPASPTGKATSMKSRHLGDVCSIFTSFKVLEHLLVP